ncbi:MAG: hypothetical protein AAB802_02665, partial [Patescibacteria group bacterium]
MKRKDPLIEALKSYKTEMDPRFAAELRKKVLVQASEQFHKPRVSVLSHFYESMKKYSLQYTACLLLIAMGVTFLIPKNLNPEEILANASEFYENQNGIYHEKVLIEYFENGQPQEPYIAESWVDEKGDYLSLTIDPDTKEIQQGYLGVINEFGETVGYKYTEPPPKPGDADYRYTDVTDDAASSWYETYLGEKVFCIKVDASNPEQINKSLLSIAIEDPSVYNVFGISHPIESETEPEVNIYELIKNSITAPTAIESIKTDPDYHYEEIQEKGRKYHVFSQVQESESPHAVTISTYIDAENFRLVKQVNGSEKEEKSSITTFLANEYLEPSAHANLFDPKHYEDFTLDGGIGTITTSSGEPMEEALNEDGCFNYETEKLSEE